MGLLRAAVTIAVLAGTAFSQLASEQYCEESTGICFASFTNFAGISYRIALPESSNTPDAIIQIEAPNSVAWAGFAWGGSMTLNPLTVAWPDTENNQVIVSSRVASSYYMPPDTYDAAEYTLLKGRGINDTHWWVTARCQGCTSWDLGNGLVDLNKEDYTTFAFAYASWGPWEPSSNISGFDIHEAFGHWSHDLDLAKHPDYESWVSQD